MDTHLLNISPQVKAFLQAEKKNWTGLNLTNIGLIGEGLSKKTKSCQVSNLLEKMRKIAVDDQFLLKFSPVTESQLLKSSNTPSNMFSKGSIFNRKYFKYKIFKADARLVRTVLENTGFSYTDSHDWTVMWLGCNAKLYLYEGLGSNQRINHFPNSYEITRKDRMCVNLMHMQQKHGPSEYGFFPETYLIPNEFSEFSTRFRNNREKWIVKPANSSQGRGIFLLENISSLRTSESCVVSRFIDNPLLINDLKFDLRIYVLVTSFAPLKIYVYDEGLARFASEKYSNFAKSNKFCFLTNYSINKLNQNYIQNEDPDVDNQGHKWSLSALMKYLRASGVDTDIILLKIYDLIIKTIITAENTVVSLVNKYSLSRNNCFDLFGFDILLDDKMSPWLLEVNLSPSLATESPLDLHIKSNLVSELFNLIGIDGQERRPVSHSVNRSSSRPSRPQTAKTSEKKQQANDLISESFSEFLRASNFVRIYPVEGCYKYDKFFNVVRKVNKALYNAMYCQDEIREISQAVITGEDLLIEFLVRLLASSDKIFQNKTWEASVKEFVDNEIWKIIGLKIGEGSWIDQLSRITAEIKRRNRLVKDLDFDQKIKILENMPNEELERSLKNTPKEIAFLVSCFFSNGVGILSQIQKFESLTPKRINFKNIIIKQNHSQEGIYKGKCLRSTSNTLNANRKKSDSSYVIKTHIIPFY